MANEIKLASSTQSARGNWVAIARSLQNHEIVGFGKQVKPADPEKPSYSRAEAWLFMIFEANWQSRKANNMGKPIVLERGELLGARGWLAKQWNWTDKAVRYFLDVLREAGMIALVGDGPDEEKIENRGQSRGQSEGQSKGQSEGQRRAHFANVIKLCNYDNFQRDVERAAEEIAQAMAIRGANQTPAKGPESNNRTIDSESVTTLESKTKVVSGPSQKREEPPKTGFRRDDAGIIRAADAMLLQLEEVYSAKNVRQILEEISPRIPDKLAGRELVRAIHREILAFTEGKRAARLKANWVLPDDWLKAALEISGQTEAWVRDQAERFRDYWHAKAGADGRKKDWLATWRNWIRNARRAPIPGNVVPLRPAARSMDERNTLRDYVGLIRMGGGSIEKAERPDLWREAEAIVARERGISAG